MLYSPPNVATLLLLSTAFWSAGALRVTPEGTLLRDGIPYRAVGVNYFDGFTRTLRDAANYDAGFEELARRKIPFARFCAGGFWPSDWNLYQTNREEYFRRFDGFVKSAESHGIGLIPSLFWQYSTVPDLVSEPVNRWGDPKSRTHAFMREYTTALVTRYASSPSIWGWEFGNEYSLEADLPNATEHRPPVVPGLGTPSKRSGEDELTHQQVRVALKAFAEEVRRHDTNHLIFTGNALPRVSAWHQARERSWRRDSPAQFAEVLAADNPSPINTLTIRAYDLTNDLSRLPAAMTVSRGLKKPMFIGEFGVPGLDRALAQPQFDSILAALETNRTDLAALWVFEFNGQSRNWSATATNSRSWQLDKIQEVNARWSKRE
jgi:hypothetical protein